MSILLDAWLAGGSERTAREANEPAETPEILQCEVDLGHLYQTAGGSSTFVRSEDALAGFDT